MTRNSPPKLGGEPARTESEQAGWFPCRYWQLREPPRPRLRSGAPPNLGGEWPHSNSFTAVTKAKFWCRNQATIYCAFIVHFERVAHVRLHRPPLKRESPTSSTLCSKPAL